MSESPGGGIGHPKVLEMKVAALDLIFEMVMVLECRMLPVQSRDIQRSSSVLFCMLEVN